MSSLQYRKDRMSQMAQTWGAEHVNELFIRKRIPKNLYDALKRSIGMYIAKDITFRLFGT